MMWVIVSIGVFGVMMWLLVAGAAKKEKKIEEDEMIRWFRENSEGYDTLYEEIRAEDVPEGFRDIFQ